MSKPQSAPAAGGHPDLADTVPPHPLPAEVTTDHTLVLPGRTLHFKATAGAVRLSDAGSGTPIADIAYVAYRLEGGDPAKRPLTVAINGGPGAASAWLDIGAVGPWRLPVRSGDISPSMPTSVVDNADTWLDFTDLLFIDPLGTGYSRALGKGDEAGKAFHSIDGDIGSLATVVRKWLIANDRLASPHFILGRELRRLPRAQAGAQARAERGRRRGRHRHAVAGARFRLVRGRGQSGRRRGALPVARRRRQGPQGAEPA